MSTDPFESLRRTGRQRLARILEEHWEEPLADYSAGLHDHRPAVELEPALAGALAAELEGLGWPEAERRRALADLERRRVLQTATHLTVSEGPTFLAVHLLATAGLPAGAPYLVGAFSGVPFSNPAWSGCLNLSARHGLEALVDPAAPLFGRLRRDEQNRQRDLAGRPAAAFERRLSLVPARMRDALVFGAASPKRLVELVAHLRPPLASLAPAGPGERFGPFALGFCQRTARRVLADERIGYFDLNRVLAAYLARVLGEPGHPMARLLLEPGLRGAVQAALADEAPWFYAPVERSGRGRVAGLEVVDGALRGPGIDLALEPDSLSAALREGRLCPGLLPSFAALVFVNGFRCLGSFEQVEYLARHRQAFRACGWPGPKAAAAAPEDGLTTGRCLAEDGRPLWPLDVVLGTAFEPGRQPTLGRLVEPLMGRLL